MLLSEHALNWDGVNTSLTKLAGKWWNASGNHSREDGMLAGCMHGRKKYDNIVITFSVDAIFNPYNAELIFLINHDNQRVLINSTSK